jgi:hypothetical protein
MIRKTIVSLTAVMLLAGAGRVEAQAVNEGGLTIYGFVSQGFARSDAVPVLGIPVGMTTDYRTVALQARYAIGDRSSAIVQLSHRRLGESLLMQSEAPLELDWAFLRHRTGPVVLQAGRFPLPRGIYNEIRDVGTLLPLFRAPFVLYEDGTETVDGVGVSASTDVGGWGIDAHAYGGGAEYKAPIHTADGSFLIDERVERNAGGQLWVSTPLQGLRAGFAMMAWDDLAFQGGLDSYIQLASLDATFDTWLLRAEHLRIRTNYDNVWASYAQGQVSVTGGLKAVAQYEIKERQPLGDAAGPRRRIMEDGALGARLSLGAFAVLKLEAHRATGYGFDQYVDMTGDPAVTWYTIASISASF